MSYDICVEVQQKHWFSNTKLKNTEKCYKSYNEFIK